MKRTYDKAPICAVNLGKVIRRYQSEGRLQSVAPPTIYGYRAFLKMARTLPGLSLRHVALATMLGHVNKADRKLLSAILKEALNEDEDHDLMSREGHCRLGNMEIPVDLPHCVSTPSLVTERIGPFSLLPREMGGFSFADEGTGRFLQLTSESIRATSKGASLSLIPQVGENSSPVDDTPAAGEYSGAQLVFLDAPIVERVVELSGSEDEYENMFSEVNPIIESLNLDLRISVNTGSQPDRRLTSGCVDSGRLGVARFASSIFKRAHTREEFLQGRWPLSLIACDGSGSMAPMYMKIIKMLCAAWIGVTAPLSVPTMVGLYHSGPICEGMTGPLVSWVCHPEKTAFRGTADAVRSVISLPHHGAGVQSDALSLSHMMAEARRMAQGRGICLTVISDCDWNSSFGDSSSGTEEVRGFFHDAREALDGKLRSCVVGLGVSGSTGLEGVVDEIVTISDSAMRNPSAVTKRLAMCVKAGIAKAPDIRRGRAYRGC